MASPSCSSFLFKKRNLLSPNVAIHMAFDCMAIAMGLFASVMATWKPNERFTYGYSRIETLSGFANGIFLILISVFIVVEAIQRL
jgi:zinc transporter 5/7